VRLAKLKARMIERLNKAKPWLRKKGIIKF